MIHALANKQGAYQYGYGSSTLRIGGYRWYNPPNDRQSMIDGDGGPPKLQMGPHPKYHRAATRGGEDKGEQLDDGSDSDSSLPSMIGSIAPIAALPRRLFEIHELRAEVQQLREGEQAILAT